MTRSTSLRKLLLAASVLLADITRAASSSTITQCDQNFCVDAVVAGSTTQYTLRTTDQKPGWIALGFGDAMIGSPMVVLWSNPDGSVTISQRKADSYLLPKVDSKPPMVASLLTTKVATTENLPKYTFSVPTSADTKQNVIWAVGTDTPASSSVDSTFYGHTSNGRLTLDLSQSSGSSGSQGSQTSSQPSSQTTSGNDASQKGGTFCDRNFCVDVVAANSAASYTLRTTDKKPGWIALGFGTNMLGSPMVVLWSNPDGSVSLSQRIATDYVLPQVDSNPPRLASLVSSLTTSSSSATLPNYTFSRPLNGDTSQSVIWALGSDTPSSSSQDATFDRHIAVGNLNLDLSKPLSDNVSSQSGGDQSLKTFERMIRAHAAISSLGFIFFLPLGAILARLWRTHSVRWYTAHWIVQFVFGGVFVFIGVVLGFAAVGQVNAKHLRDGHQKRGLALFILFFFQCLLGAIIHFFKPKVSYRPVQNYFHAILGLFIIGLGFYQVRDGFHDEWPLVTGKMVDRSVLIVWDIWLAIVLVLYVGGLAFLKRQYAQERKSRNGGRSKFEAN